MIDQSTEFGARVARHLRDEIVVWMTTVTPAGAPLNAAVDRDTPPADRSEDYLSKYDEHITRLGMTPESFAKRYHVPVRIRLARLRGH